MGEGILSNYSARHTTIRHSVSQGSQKPRRWDFRRLTAFVVLPALLVTGMTILDPVVQSAQANSFTPTVEVTNTNPKGFLLAGEDAEYSVSFSHKGSDADQFNTSVKLLLPIGIDYVSSAGLGTPKIYAPGATLPNAAANTADPNYATDSVVPAGFQVWVWENIMDLPQGGGLWRQSGDSPRCGCVPSRNPRA